MERPSAHVTVEILEVWVFGDGLIEWLPPQTDAKHLHKCGFSHADIPCHCNKLLHCFSPNVFLHRAERRSEQRVAQTKTAVEARCSTEFLPPVPCRSPVGKYRAVVR